MEEGANIMVHNWKWETTLFGQRCLTVVNTQFCNNLVVNNLNNRILSCSFVQFFAPPCIVARRFIVMSVDIGYNTETVFTTLKTTLLASEVNPRRLLNTNHPPSGREVIKAFVAPYCGKYWKHNKDLTGTTQLNCRLSYIDRYQYANNNFLRGALPSNRGGVAGEWWRGAQSRHNRDKLRLLCGPLSLKNLPPSPTTRPDAYVTERGNSDRQTST